MFLSVYASHLSHLPSCQGVSVSVLPTVFAGHCVNLCSLAVNKVQLGSVGAAAVSLQQPDRNQCFLAWHESDPITLLPLPSMSHQGTEAIQRHYLLCYDKSIRPFRAINSICSCHVALCFSLHLSFCWGLWVCPKHFEVTLEWWVRVFLIKECSFFLTITAKVSFFFCTLLLSDRIYLMLGPSIVYCGNISGFFSCITEEEVMYKSICCIESLG